jgi:hypothetical protein
MTFFFSFSSLISTPSVSAENTRTGSIRAGFAFNYIREKKKKRKREREKKKKKQQPKREREREREERDLTSFSNVVAAAALRCACPHKPCKMDSAAKLPTPQSTPNSYITQREREREREKSATKKVVNRIIGERENIIKNMCK